MTIPITPYRPAFMRATITHMKANPDVPGSASINVTKRREPGQRISAAIPLPRDAWLSGAGSTIWKNIANAAAIKRPDTAKAIGNRKRLRVRVFASIAH
jgi:hypothetical protein